MTDDEIGAYVTRRILNFFWLCAGAFCAGMLAHKVYHHFWG